MYFIKNLLPKYKITENLLLGRWKINYSKNHLDRKIYLANHDHCGPCGSIDKLPKLKKKNINL